MDDISLGSVVPWATAVSIGPHDQPWTAPVSISLLWSFSGQFFTGCCHLPPHPPAHILPPTHPLSTLAQNWCTPSKKRSEIA